MPNQYFRQNLAESLSHIPPQNASQVFNSDLASHFIPGNNSKFTSPLESDHSFILPPNTLGQAKVHLQNKTLVKEQPKTPIKIHLLIPLT